MSEISNLIKELIEFRNLRDWKQFHNSKDLALAINIEAGELLELFLWKENEDFVKEKLEEELADVLSFCLLLAEKHDLDVSKIIQKKIRLNNKKYPIEKAKGNSKKYNEL
ncbi:nucleotide pyrophosphohydrolase [Psychroserpens sp. SPM9]|uniref:nucleotide pyrophosphohydrolase n=1 Tax=Psychroserpens sp. SPM9 TaxID=2975598 RepID=UPI0021A62C64|nr:nucleotide pyrophosphohydrolase [Psychroserpens sp. SPM9]MDG5493176.1 nucleotide pyrophosphohydrolase [Psychroserpens sp. SPM9]